MCIRDSIKSAPRGASRAILLLSPDMPSARRIIGTSRASLLCPQAGDTTRNRELSAPPNQSRTIAVRRRLAQIRACNIFYLPRRLPPARSGRRSVRPCVPAATLIADYRLQALMLRTIQLAKVQSWPNLDPAGHMLGPESFRNGHERAERTRTGNQPGSCSLTNPD